jgi:hypothetical protein
VNSLCLALRAAKNSTEAVACCCMADPRLIGTTDFALNASNARATFEELARACDEDLFQLHILLTFFLRPCLDELSESNFYHKLIRGMSPVIAEVRRAASQALSTLKPVIAHVTVHPDIPFEGANLEHFAVELLQSTEIFHLAYANYTEGISVTPPQAGRRETAPLRSHLAPPDIGSVYRLAALPPASNPRGMAFSPT